MRPETGACLAHLAAGVAWDSITTSWCLKEEGISGKDFGDVPGIGGWEARLEMLAEGVSPARAAVLRGLLERGLDAVFACPSEMGAQKAKITACAPCAGTLRQVRGAAKEGVNIECEDGVHLALEFHELGEFLSELCFAMAAEGSLGWWVHRTFFISERCKTVGANLAGGRCTVHAAEDTVVDVALAAEAGAALSAPGECFTMERAGISGKKIFIQNGGIPCGITGEKDVWQLVEFAVRRWA